MDRARNMGHSVCNGHQLSGWKILTPFDHFQTTSSKLFVRPNVRLFVRTPVYHNCQLSSWAPRSTCCIDTTHVKSYDRKCVCVCVCFNIVGYNLVRRLKQQPAHKYQTHTGCSRKFACDIMSKKRLFNPTEEWAKSRGFLAGNSDYAFCVYNIYIWRDTKNIFYI